MEFAYFLVGLISFQLVWDTRCDVISSVIDELKEWTDYFGFTEYPNLWKYYTNDDVTEEGSESQHLFEKVKVDEQTVQSRVENILEDDISSLTKELPQDTEYVDDNNIWDVLPEVDNSGSNEISNSNKSKVQEVPSTLESDPIQKINHKKSVSFSKGTENGLVENDSSEEMNEIIMYDDMVKIEFPEEIESTGHINLVGKNKDGSNKNHKTFSNSVNEDKAIENNIHETKKENKLDNLLQSEKNTPENEDGLSPSSEPQTKLYIELPIADDEDDLNILSLFSKCSDDSNSEFCSQKDATLSSEIKKNTVKPNLEETIKENEQDSDD